MIFFYTTANRVMVDKMMNRRDTLKVLLGGTAVAANFGFINSAVAERVYDHAERKWVEVDLNQIRTDRRVPSKYKRV